MGDHLEEGQQSLQQAVSPPNHEIGLTLRQSKSPNAPLSSNDIQSQINSPLNTLLKRIINTGQQAAAAAKQLKEWLNNLTPEVNGGWAMQLRARIAPSRKTKGDGEVEQTTPAKRKDALQWLQQILANALADLAQLPDQVKQWSKQVENRFDDSITTLVKKHAAALTKAFNQLMQNPMEPSAPEDARALHQTLCDQSQELEMMKQLEQVLGQALRNRYEELSEQQNALEGVEMTDAQMCDVCVEQVLLLSPVQQQYRNLEEPSRRAVLNHYGSLANHPSGFFSGMRNTMTLYTQERQEIRQVERNCTALGKRFGDVDSKHEDNVEGVLSVHQKMIQLRMTLQQRSAPKHEEDQQQQSSTLPTPCSTRPSLTPGG